MTISRHCWKDAVNLFAFIQKRCSYPGAFWYGYKWRCHDPSGRIIELTTNEVVKRGGGPDVLDTLKLDPEILSDFHNTTPSIWNINLPS